MERTMGYYNTFVVKVWCDEAQGIRRGRIQHVSSQEHAYFLSLQDMTNFIASHLGPPSSDSLTQDMTLGGSVLLAEDFGDSAQDE